MKRHEFQNHIVKKAWTDPDFKKKLLGDPKGAISSELGKIKEGVSIPDNVKVSVVEEAPDHIYMVLPVNPGDVTGKAISEADLSKVAGGTSTDVAATTVTTTATTVSLDVVQVVGGVIDNGVVVSTISSPS